MKVVDGGLNFSGAAGLQLKSGAHLDGLGVFGIGLQDVVHHDSGFGIFALHGEEFDECLLKRRLLLGGGLHAPSYSRRARS